MKIFKYQLWNLFFLGGLLFLLDGILKKEPSLLVGEFWGVSTYGWMMAAVLVPIVHQFYVVVAWRAELYYQWISKTFGEKGFPLFKVGFAILILLRPVTITCLAVANRDSFEANNAIIYLVVGLLLIPSVYLFYSVKTYFGIDKAFGIDHFKPEEVSHEPMVKKGIYKYTSNGMYVYGFLILYIPGLLAHSSAALLIALFNHVFIWAHYYFTERPDMKVIYKKY